MDARKRNEKYVVTAVILCATRYCTIRRKRILTFGKNRNISSVINEQSYNVWCLSEILRHFLAILVELKVFVIFVINFEYMP